MVTTNLPMSVSKDSQAFFHFLLPDHFVVLQLLMPLCVTAPECMQVHVFVFVCLQIMSFSTETPTKLLPTADTHFLLFMTWQRQSVCVRVQHFVVHPLGSQVVVSCQETHWPGLMMDSHTHLCWLLCFCVWGQGVQVI